MGFDLDNEELKATRKMNGADDEIKVGEVWRDIEDFSNYQISNFGRVKSKERITNVGIKNVKQITRNNDKITFIFFI